MYFFGQDKVKDCLFNPLVYSSFSVICEIFWLEFGVKCDRQEPKHQLNYALKRCYITLADYNQRNLAE